MRLYTDESSILRKRIFYTALLPVINLSICYLLIYWTYIYLYMNLSILLLLSVLFIHRKERSLFFLLNSFFQFFHSLSLRFFILPTLFLLSTLLNLFSFFSLSLSSFPSFYLVFILFYLVFLLLSLFFHVFIFSVLISTSL